MNYIDKKIIFSDKAKAEEFVHQCEQIFDAYGMLSLADVNDLLNVKGEDKDRDYGWVRNADIAAIRIVPELNYSAYRVLFPKPYLIAEPESSANVKVIEEVDHPDHYQSETGLEAIDVIEAFTFDLKGIEAFCTGNALKYLCRWKRKNGKKDLKKARWYIDRLINHIEKLEKENEQS